MFTTIEYIKSLGYKLPRGGANDNDAALQAIIDRIEPFYLVGVVGRTLYNDMVANPTDPDVLSFVNGVEGETLNETYNGVKYDIANICISLYYADLSNNVNNSGFSNTQGTLTENENFVNQQFYINNIWSCAISGNCNTYEYLKSGVNPFFETWQQSYFNYLENIGLW